MAYNDNQNDYPLPGDRPEKRESAEFLPRYFRTETNRKFLSSTLDQLLSPGVAEKVSGYIGRRQARAFKSDDNYIPDVTPNRESYQLEPSVIIKDNLDNVTFYKDYNDYINQLDSFGGSVKDHSRLNAGEYYSWNPNIDWDKFVNYREYFWLPTGPDSVDVFGETRDVESTYSVSIEENADNTVFKFSPPGLTQNPILDLYRGVTYKFEIDTPGFPIAFATSRKLNNNGEFTSIYDDGQTKIEQLEDDNTEEVEFVEKGYIEFTIPLNAPDVLYYVSSTNIDTSGLVRVNDLVDATYIDVDEIVGKKTYKTEGGFDLSNGMKVKFRGNVTPSKYAESEWYVEGVGDKIKFIDQSTLIIPSVYSDDIPVPFDSNKFDKLPFANANSYAGNKDYITINRASKDLNAWSRYNRWFHKSVIEKTAEINNTELSLDQDTRAKRPIIEFLAGLKLYNFGSQSKVDVDLIDTFTRDAFSDIEGNVGYNIDGIDVTDGMRILFSADTDIRVKNKIYQIKFITHNNTRQIALIETADTNPTLGETILIKQGVKNSGKIWHYTDTGWNAAQEKTKVNQQPLFDLYDKDGNAYSDKTVYDSSTFFGNKVFSYKVGTGTNDTELGFPLSYRSIQNSGDIVFEFNLLTESAEYQVDNVIETKNTDVAFLRQYDSLDSFAYTNGWSKPRYHSKQSVYRQYIIEADNLDTFEIDVYKKPNTIQNLWLRVYVNNVLQKENTDYVRETNNLDQVFVKFNNPLSEDDAVLIKTRADANKTSNGFYEIPYNLERNPKNENITTFTLGEVNDHVDSMIEELPSFEGLYPGPSNLRDLGNVNPYGTRFLKHSHPLNLAIYHTTNTDANLIKAVKFARAEYAKFKRQFLQVANTLGFDGPVKEHVDRVLKEVNKEKTKESPFYFSDMLSYTGARRTIFEVEDPGNVFFALSQPFTLTTLSQKAVGVYLNGVQLVYGKDFTFNDEGFCIITVTKQNGDIIELYQYETTDGCYIPPTPTKLGFYPKYQPEIFIDDTYLEPVKVIQGHDGSITKAYDDFRDDLLLELEKRIFNNLKQEYRKDIFDIHKLQKGIFREQGISKLDIDSSMISDFTQWLSIAGNPDYSDNSAWLDGSKPFTFNYSFTSSPNDKPLKGFWRAVYRQAYDTDRPHTHPWEMLGFTIKPSWWEEQYGPAPYTRDNFVLWEDLQNGAVKDPNAPIRILDEYKRPGLLNNIPVNEVGNLISPLESNLAQGHVPVLARTQFAYGDEAPVESAWRRSSEYPFALLTAFILNKPAETIGIGFDLSRVSRNLADQLVYAESQKPISLDSIVFPNTTSDTARTTTSGLVDYMNHYLTSDVTVSYEKYKSDLQKINNQLSYKIGGFTEKNKFQLLLDSRSPANQSNVFVPQENYKIFLNKSSAVKTINYSGVIIEKAPSGYSVRGYDSINPVFNYNRAIPKNSDKAITIGGITQPFLDWAAGQEYIKGSNVRYENIFYKTTTGHRSTNVFDINNFQEIAALPVQGGATGFLRKNFETELSQLPYGTVLRDLQEVVDFLLGYEQYLIGLGFRFEYYDEEYKSIQNWTHSIKEFLFWSTQNWRDGSILTLSPGATKLCYTGEFAVVDDLFDTFYPYSILRADANKIDPEFINVFREGNNFEVSLRNTSNGIFNIRLNLVQHEHVVVIDNSTVFNDVVYDLAPGYRQERIKVIGYRSDNWNGSLSVPGFIYDSAETSEWTQFTDYQLGDIVKYKEFYYSADKIIEGSSTFNSSDWVRLDSKPQATLYTNLDYKASQFSDFYDLDTDNFDTEQQKLAQHLIGYQKRQYLANIINDDVSQYKFYQGFIQDKGTTNSLTKLFDALASADKESLEFYEEWAIRLGQYGAADGFDEIEYLLDEKLFKLSPQPIELVQSIPPNPRDDILRIRPFETYLAPKEYDHKPFPTKASAFVEKIKTAGYVNPDDVQFSYVSKNFITSADGVISSGEYAWIAQEGDSWEVFKSTSINNSITDAAVAVEGNTVTVTTDKAIGTTVKSGDIIGILDITNLEGYHVVQEVSSRSFTLPKPNAFINPVENANGILTSFQSVRFSNLTELNSYAQTSLENFDSIWIDNDGTGNWAVYKNTSVYDLKTILENPQNNTDSTRDNFGSTLAVNDNNTILAVGAPDYFTQGAIDGTRISQGSGIDTIRTPGTYTELELYQYRGPGTGARFTVVTSALGTSTITVTDPGIGYNGGEEVTISVSNIGGTGTDLKFFIVTNKGGVVNIYSRGNESGNYNLLQTLAPDTSLLAEITEPTRFGASVAISGDGRYLAVGSPNASRVLTRYRGEFAPSTNYTKNQIVSYNESLWQARKSVLSSEENILYTSFDAYSFIAEQSDSTDIKLLLAGNNRFSGTAIDHVLIRAPKDQYEGTEIGDTVVLKWNNYSVAHLGDTITNVEPFAGAYSPAITKTILSNSHVIQKKIDHVFNIENYTVLPLVGDRIETTSASGKVEYIYNDAATREAVIYLSETNGIFLQTDEIFLEGGVLVGTYTEDNFNNINVLGGYWLINTTTYSVNASNYTDTGRGLIYRDVLNLRGDDGDLATPDVRTIPYYYYNIQDNIQDITYTTENDRVSFLTHLSYTGIFDTTIEERPSPWWVVRVPTALSDALAPADSFKFYADTLGSYDLENTGLSFDTLNGTHTIVEEWDGYIDMEFTEFQTVDLEPDGNLGDPIEPTPKYEFDTSGNLITRGPGLYSIVRDLVTGATAEVMFYQRQFNNVRLYVSNVTGNWLSGSQFGETAAIERVGSPSRTMGEVLSTSLGSTEVGKLLLISEGVVSTGTGTDASTGNNFAASTNTIDLEPQQLNKEYWIYEEENILGAPRPASYPDSRNNEWTLIFNLPASEFGVDSGFTNEGLFSVYEKAPLGEYILIDYFTLPDRGSNRKLGYDLKFAKNNDLYTLFVSEEGNETADNYGKIYIIKNGSDGTSTFDWEIAKDKKYRGNFDVTSDYNQDELVIFNDGLYQAVTNLAPGPFLLSNWNEFEDNISRLGFVPSTQTLKLGTESIFDPHNDGLDSGIVKFAQDFDVSNNGNVLAVSASLVGSDSTANSAIAIYRKVGGNYQFSQEILGNDSVSGFGVSISLSDDGNYLAVGENLSDDKKINQGNVYIYKLQNQQFVLVQTLNSANNEVNEKFGSKVSFDGKILAVTGLQTDAIDQTTFDVYSERDVNSESKYSSVYANNIDSPLSNARTIIDGNYTSFVTKTQDTGAVYMFENINDVFVYSESLSYQDDDYFYLGENIGVKNNHVYIATPRVSKEDYQGTILEYRKPNGTTAWNITRSPSPIVDTDKFRGAYLYNTKTNKIIDYIDILDPVQGKIAGKADAEIDYKTLYDPALYNIINGELQDQNTSAWSSNAVGKIWWNIRNTRFYNTYQSDIIFQTNYWNTIFPGTEIEIYEWVESVNTPSQWDDLSGTAEGEVLGISGTTRYGDNFYTEKQKYDPVAQRFTQVYYYWVRNKRTVPIIENRNLSADDIRALIENPFQEGYKFAALLSNNKFALYNCNLDIEDKDVAINFSYWTIENQEQNIHTEYQLMTEGLETSLPKSDIEVKWFDSLIGYDEYQRPVPDPTLSDKQKYGTLFKPRQSWFRNRAEALKEVVDRINSVTKQYVLTDLANFSVLNEKDPLPNINSNLYDTQVDTYADIEFIGTAKAIQAELTPRLVDGEIVQIEITNPGRGYIRPPSYEIVGEGSGAELQIEIDALGKVSNVNILRGGKNYTDTTSIKVRKFSALVSADENATGRWTINEFDSVEKVWKRTTTQTYDVSKFWKYIDWYAPGYNEFSGIDAIIDATYELSGLEVEIGSTVKIGSVGTGGWLLLEKIANIDTEDYTINYKTIGRQDGTIEFLSSLYDVVANRTGFDTTSFDTRYYDIQPIIETRKILQTIRDDIFTDELRVEYNKLFFASLRYVFAEQNYVDWAFKTSFIKSKHNVGELEQRLTFSNDNLENYQEYVNEVKPFKTKVREYISGYDKTEPTNSVTTDFDLPPYYDVRLKQIVPESAKTTTTGVTGISGDMQQYPKKHWLDNVGYGVTSVNIADSGTGFLQEPVISLIGGGGTGATAKAYIGDGKITRIQVLTTGSGYITAPQVVINGSQDVNSTEARASAVLGNSKVRGVHVRSKFDRVSGNFYITSLSQTENFTGTGADLKFALKWPIDLKSTKTVISIDGIESLRSEYVVSNIKDTSKSYTRNLGQIEFINPPVSGTAIKVEYFYDINLLDAQDRINFFYNPTTGMIGKDVAQLMDGIDYGGVEVKSLQFDAPAGWDTGNWFATTWDTYDNTFEDEIFRTDSSTVTIELQQPLETGVIYNVYKNGVRIDAEDYVTPGGSATNPNAILQSITGAGQETLDVSESGLDIPLVDDDILIIRKSTSDGSFLPDPLAYDTQLTGGNLQYTTAKGIDAEEINLDGDGFVTQTTSKGPEELVPGQLVDTLDIRVYHRVGDGGSTIYSQSYVTDGTTSVYDLGIKPNTNQAVFVRLDNTSVAETDYTLDLLANTITFVTVPTVGGELNIITMGIAGEEILDINEFIADGSSIVYELDIPYQTNASYYVQANREQAEVIVFETENNKFGLNFTVAPAADTIISYGIFFASGVNYSHVKRDTFYADGSTLAFTLSNVPFYAPPVTHKSIVTVGDKILNPGYNQRFDVSSAREYQLQLFQQPNVSLLPDQVDVYLNGVQLEQTINYRYDIFNTSVVLFSGVGKSGDVLEVFVNDAGEYTFDPDTNELIIDTSVAMPIDTKVEVVQFSNHDIQDLTRISYDVVNRTTLAQGTTEYVEYHNLTTGLIKLRGQAIDAQYVWVSVNGDKLIPSIDYFVTDDRAYIQILSQLTENDVIDIIHFRAPVLTERFGFRQFKDMLNRTHYKRLNDTYTFELAQELNWYDLRIEVVDASNLTEPNKTKNMPGVLFIDGERIEYFVKEGNTLRQLRRGTLGTGVKQVYIAGTRLFDQSAKETIPYKDEIISSVLTPDGSTGNFELDFVPSNENDFEVFAGGKRLRKNEIEVFDRTIDQDSPEADVTVEPEFAISGNILTLNYIPSVNEKVIIVRKQGKVWNATGTSLTTADNDIARFLRDATVDLPE